MKLAARVARKILRVIEGPPVRERTVVRRVDSSKRPRCKPGFIIGVYRSGTTLLRYVLDSHPNIAVPPETNFLHGLKALWESEWYRKGLQGTGVDETGLPERLAEFARGILDDYAAARGKSRWFEKTPSYVDLLDFIDLLFGKECQYLMLYRHGLDVANSLARMQRDDAQAGPARRYLDEFPDSPRLAGARYWVDQCEKMLAFEACHPQQCFRLHYEQLAVEPEPYLRPLFEFLDEPWDPDVLRFAAKPHDFGLQDSKILETRGFAPSTNGYRTWPAEEIARAREIVHDTMKKLAYRT